MFFLLKGSVYLCSLWRNNLHRNSWRLKRITFTNLDRKPSALWLITETTSVSLQDLCRNVGQTTTPLGPAQHDGLGSSPQHHGLHQHEVDGRRVRPEGGFGPGAVREDADHLAEEEDRSQREGQDRLLLTLKYSPFKNKLARSHAGGILLELSRMD